MRRFIILLAFITALVLPAQALARSTREDVPNGPAGVHQYHRFIPTPEGEEPVPPEATLPTGGPGTQLPFTGEDVLLIVLVGALLAGGGLVLYRQARQRS
jgi:LPXTG-motif cell wall-anchored protein